MGEKRVFGAWHFLLLLFLLPRILWARDIPALTGPVVDEAGVFSPQGKIQVAAALDKFFRESKNQFQVLTIHSLEGDVLEDFSIRVADAWKIGDREGDRGLIIIVAQQERRVRIEVGQGLEGDIPDAFAGRVIDQVMVPEFRSGSVERGVILGLQALAEKLGGQLDLNAIRNYRHEQGSSDWAGALIVVLICFFLIYSRRNGRGRGMGYWGGGPGGFSSGGGFSGGGSSWGGGGGGFSGGGSSGGW